MSRRDQLMRLARAARDLAPPDGRRRFQAARTVGPAFPPDAAVYAGLSPFSTLLSRVETVRGRTAGVNLLLPSARTADLFAGAKTALAFGQQFAAALARPLAIGTVLPRSGGTGVLDPSLARDGDPPVPVFCLGDGATFPVSGDDLWIVTHWTTAHAADVACRAGVLDPDRVVYLVQDYEPGFLAWSTDYALVRATYHRGFTLVLNSRPLAEHLAAAEGLTVDPDLVIAPHLPVERLEAVASARRAASGTVGVFFYGRPTKPRNLYALGVSALQRTGQLLGPDARRLQVISAGEPHAPFSVPNAPPVELAGQTGWDGYFDLLARVHTGLSLMYSPHPSHPPLELAMSGATAVTNRFGTARDGLHPRITAVDADPELLAEALADRVREALDAAPAPFVPLEEGRLGRPLDDVIASLTARVAGGAAAPAGAGAAEAGA